MAKNTTIDGYSLDGDGVWSQPIGKTSSNSGNDKKDAVSNNKLNLNWYEVQKINISIFPAFFNDFDTSEEKQIQKITEYLNSLSTSETELDPGDYLGGGYHLRVYLKNGSIREFGLSGNKFFMEIDKFTYEIPYKEATKFGAIVGNILEENENKTFESSISGRVTSVKAEKSGRDISCIIKDENNKTYNINLENSKIIDATENGCLILHKGDVVNVYYQNGAGVTNDGINALTVYIKNAADNID